MAAGNDRPPPNTKTDRIRGSVLGLALGDAFGAPYEGDVLERALWAVIGRRNGRRRWTDDTQMTLDVVESLVVCGRIDQSDLARRFAGDSEAALVQAASDAAMITHAHPLGREGAVLIALATCLAYHDMHAVAIIERLRQRADAPEFSSRLHTAKAWLQAGNDISPRAVANELGNGIAAVASCVTAIYAGMDALPSARLAQLEQSDRLPAAAQSLASAIDDRTTPSGPAP